MTLPGDVTGFSDAAGGGRPNGPALVLLRDLLDMLGSSEPNGLTSIVESFGRAGVSHVISSWIGTGWNLTISRQELQQAFGAPRIQQLAQSSGLSENVVAGVLANWLPGVIDELTPGGIVPDSRRLQRRVSTLKRALGV